MLHVRERARDNARSPRALIAQVKDFGFLNQRDAEGETRPSEAGPAASVCLPRVRRTKRRRASARESWFAAPRSARVDRTNKRSNSPRSLRRDNPTRSRTPRRSRPPLPRRSTSARRSSRRRARARSDGETEAPRRVIACRPRHRQCITPGASAECRYRACADRRNTAALSAARESFSPRSIAARKARARSLFSEPRASDVIRVALSADRSRIAIQRAHDSGVSQTTALSDVCTASVLEVQRMEAPATARIWLSCAPRAGSRPGGA